jgi:hypothetical protein
VPEKPPTGLRAPGRRLWDAVVGPYILTPSEMLILREACRTADELDRLEKALRELNDLVVSGSTGQPRAHPLLEEVRAHRVLVDKLVNSLNLPDFDEVIGLKPTSKHAQKAAAARWNRTNNGAASA